MSEQLDRLAIASAHRGVLAYQKLVVNPNFEIARHHEEIGKVLQTIVDGQRDRAIIMAPPRSGKSHLISEGFPAYYLGRFPDRFVISASYGQDLANDFGAKVRNILQDPLHSLVFPDSVMSADSTARDHFTTTKGGTYFAVGIGSAATGRGAHLLLIDDPVKDKEAAYSVVERKKTWDWYRQVAYTRLQPGAAIVAVMTRWHPGDLCGRLLEREKTELQKEGWFVLCLPAIAEEGDLWRQPGEALWPSRYPLSALNRTRRALIDETGEHAWLALYQQRPVAEGGGMFKGEWVQYYKKKPDHTDMNRYLIVDPASSKKANSDYTAMVVVGLARDRNVYILDMIRDRLSLTERTQAVLDLRKKWMPLGVGYESYGLQADIEHIQDIQETVNNRFVIRKLGGNLKKEDRIRRLVPLFENGRVWFPEDMIKNDYEGRPHDLVEDFVEEELAAYPAARHDDMLDALSRLLDDDMHIIWPVFEEYESGPTEPLPSWESA